MLNLKTLANTVNCGLVFPHDRAEFSKIRDQFRQAIGGAGSPDRRTEEMYLPIVTDFFKGFGYDLSLRRLDKDARWSVMSLKKISNTSPDSISLEETAAWLTAKLESVDDEFNRWLRTDSFDAFRALLSTTDGGVIRIVRARGLPVMAIVVPVDLSDFRSGEYTLE
jgi:hypothetical protein